MKRAKGTQIQDVTLPWCSALRNGSHPHRRQQSGHDFNPKYGPSATEEPDYLQNLTGFPFIRTFHRNPHLFPTQAMEKEKTHVLRL